MIFVSLGLLAFAIGDLLRWSPEPVSSIRTGGAIVGSAALILAVAFVADLSATEPRIWIVIAAVAAWLLFDCVPRTRSKPGYPLATITIVFAGLLAWSGPDEAVGGELAAWYGELGFPFTSSVRADQFLLGLSGALFLLATGNRIVRLVLAAAGTPAPNSEAKLRGGRLLGPMERLIVGAMVLSGDPTGAALVTAAKSLLRLPEVRSATDRVRGHDDQITEYLLIGTFSSILLAATVALLVSGSG